MVGTIIFGTIALIFSSYLLGIGLPTDLSAGTILLAVQVSIALGILNLTVKPFLKIITIPLHFLSFGLFSFVINGFLVYTVSKMLPDFRIPDIVQGIYFSIFFTICMSFYHLVADDDGK